jgi:hypothetical protein
MMKQGSSHIYHSRGTGIGRGIYAGIGEVCATRVLRLFEMGGTAVEIRDKSFGIKGYVSQEWLGQRWDSLGHFGRQRGVSIVNKEVTGGSKMRVSRVPHAGCGLK